MSATTKYTTRILARTDSPGEATELDWINGRVRILGEPYHRAVKAIENMLNDGSMKIVRVEYTDV